MELDLSKVKAVFVDFDDTGCVHLTHERNHKEWITAMFRGEASFYNPTDYKVLPGLSKLLCQLKEQGCVIYGLTWTDYNFTANTKGKWFDEHYPNTFDGCVGCGSREKKLSFLKDYCEIEDLNPEEILVIDDLYKTLDEARDCGYQVMSASEVTVRYTL